MRLVRSLTALVAVLVLTGCAAPGSTPAPSGATGTAGPTSSAAQPSPTERPPCPFPEGGECLGPLAAGTFTSTAFGPTLRFTVPDGWTGCADLADRFCLLPPGGAIEGVEAGTSDAIVVDASVAAATPDCAAPFPDEGAALVDPEGIADELAQRPGLVSTPPKPVNFGGLHGFILTVRPDPAWTGTCPAGTGPAVALLVGRAPSDVVRGLAGSASTVTRLYLLGYDDGTLAVEVTDASGGGFDAADPVLRSFYFGDLPAGYRP